MKKLIVGIAIVMSIILGSVGGLCDEKAPDFPSVDVVIVVDSPVGPINVVIPQGYLNEDKHGQTWITFEEFQKMHQQPPAEKNKYDRHDACGGNNVRANTGT